MSGKRELLRAEGLCAGYGGPRSGADKDVISRVSFTLREGERLCVIGPNGCGKTTLLRVLAGTLPYRGSLLLAAGGDEGGFRERRTLKNREAARETGFLAQLSAAYFPYTVRETVELGRYARSRPSAFPTMSDEDRLAAGRAMEDAGVETLKDEEIGRLSGGQLQRVFYARTLAQSPSILLLDEPTNHLDLRYQLELVARLRSWTGEGNRGAVGVFHDLSLALAFADRFILMDRGTITDQGDPREVVRGEAINRAYGIDVAKSMAALFQGW